MRVSALGSTRPEPSAHGRPTRPVCAARALLPASGGLDSAERAPCPSQLITQPRRSTIAADHSSDAAQELRQEETNRGNVANQLGVEEAELGRPQPGPGRRFGSRRFATTRRPGYFRLASSLADERIGGAILGLAFALVCAVATKAMGREDRHGRGLVAAPESRASPAASPARYPALVHSCLRCTARSLCLRSVARSPARPSLVWIGSGSAT